MEPAKTKSSQGPFGSGELKTSYIKIFIILHKSDFLWMGVWEGCLYMCVCVVGGLLSE